MPTEYKIPEIQCRVCKKELDKSKFQSVFEANKHYKTIKCKCGNTVTIPVTFSGSGHDEWDGEIEKKRRRRINRKKIKVERKIIWQ